MSAVAKNEVLSSLAIMGYPENYISRAVKIHSKSKFGTNYNLSLLVEIIDRLKQKDAAKKVENTSFCGHFSSPESLLQYLSHSHLIDYRFDNGRYILCKIIEKDLYNEYKILLHPASQPLGVTKHNKYCYIYTEYTKLAISKSVTMRKIRSISHLLYNVKMDEYIDINPSLRLNHSGWKHGQIIKMDPNSSQVKVVYFANNTNHCYWIHLENVNEAAPFNSKYNPLKDNIMSSFNEYHDDSALKRFTSIDVIDNNNNASSISSSKEKEVDIMNQLINFGYKKKDIFAAMNIAKDRSDINSIIECINEEKREEKNNNNNNNEFDANLSSMMVGNDLMMDDIIGQMQLGDDGNNDEVDYVTPMGPDINDDEAPIAFDPNNNNIMHGMNEFEGDNNELEGDIIELNDNNNKKKNDEIKEKRKRSESTAKKLWKSGKKKILKRKKKSIKDKDNDGKMPAIFGVAATDLECSLISDYCSAIPNVLIKLKRELFINNGHFSEGIFRIAPNHDQCKQIEDELNDSKLETINWSQIAGDIIANMIKLWFRSLPNPILQDIVNKIEKCQNTQNADTIIRNDLIEPKKSYFLWLLDLCSQIVKYESYNKMGIKAIAVVFAPNLYDPSKMKNPMQAMSLSGDFIRFLQIAIEWRQFNMQK